MDFYYKSMPAILCSLLLSSICFLSLVESINNGGITVDLIHRDSSRAPSYDPSNTRIQRLRSAFDRAFSRKTSLMSMDAPVSPAGGEYLMKIKIGTPPVEQLGIADRGSDLTWTQCKPCTHCYKQKLPLFDPSRFSYCLALLNSNATSKISFGRSAVVAGPKVVSTPLVKKAPDTYYYLTLEGVSVGRKRLDMPSSTKALGGGDGNIIMDSGTTLTFVPSELYGGVEAALEKAVKGNRVSDPRGMFKLCYRSEGVVRSPPIKGADLVLPQQSIFVEVEEGIVCLTLAPSQDLAIFGNLHQMNNHIGYDLVKRQVSFQQTENL